MTAGSRKCESSEGWGRWDSQRLRRYHDRAVTADSTLSNGWCRSHISCRNVQTALVADDYVGPQLGKCTELASRAEEQECPACVRDHLAIWYDDWVAFCLGNRVRNWEGVSSSSLFAYVVGGIIGLLGLEIAWVLYRRLSQ